MIFILGVDIQTVIYDVVGSVVLLLLDVIEIIKFGKAEIVT